MHDKELVMEVLRQIEEAAAKIAVRFQAIHKVSDFTDSPVGVDKMDAICMMLIVIGESLQNLDKITGGKLLPQYREVAWKKAKGMRDILPHPTNWATIVVATEKAIPSMKSAKISWTPPL